MNTYFIRYQVQIETKTDLRTGKKLNIFKDGGDIIDSPTAREAVDKIAKSVKRTYQEVKLIFVTKL